MAFLFPAIPLYTGLALTAGVAEIASAGAIAAPSALEYPIINSLLTFTGAGALINEIPDIVNFTIDAIGSVVQRVEGSGATGATGAKPKAKAKPLVSADATDLLSASLLK